MSDRPYRRVTYRDLSEESLEFEGPSWRPFYRRYPCWWMTGRRNCTPGYPKSLRNTWHRRGRRAEDAALRRDGEDYTPVYGRRRPGNWWEWY